MDLRNNLVVIRRYLPKYLRTIYRRDWTQRYIAIARKSGNTQSAIDAIIELRSIRTDEKHTPLNSDIGTTESSAVQLNISIDNVYSLFFFHRT